jgi:drug/metabolite transporter (DMT)-like permease
VKRGVLVLGFLLLLMFDTLGQVGFKMIALHTAPVEISPRFALLLMAEPWTLAVIIAYLGAFLTYMSLMRNLAIGPLFAATHLDIVTIAFIGVMVFHETLAPVQLLGCLAILLGLAVLSKGGARS